MNMSIFFNSSLDFSQFVSASTSNFTGSDSLSLLLVLGLLVLIGALMKMPLFLVVLAIFPVLVLFSVVEYSLFPIVGVVIGIIGISLFALSPIK